MGAAGFDKPLDTTVEIETPEHVSFRYHVAGPARRFFAYLIDAMVRGAIVFLFGLVALLAGFAVDDELGQASMGVILLVLFAVEWGYYVVCDVAWSGRSPGKRALSLRVVSESGHPLRFGQSLLRNLVRAADFLPNLYVVGVLVMGRDPRFRRLGDLVAGTMVVVESRHAVEGPLRIEPLPSPKELAGLPQRLPLSGDDLEAIELLLRREPLLAPARAYELAEMVAPIYARRLGHRYRDPLRFLKLLYARARGVVGSTPGSVAATPHGPRGWAPPGGAPSGAPRGAGDAWPPAGGWGGSR